MTRADTTLAKFRQALQETYGGVSFFMASGRAATPNLIAITMSRYS